MPLMPVLRRYVLGSAVIFTDDTTLALKAERGERRGSEQASDGVSRCCGHSSLRRLCPRR